MTMEFIPPLSSSFRTADRPIRNLAACTATRVTRRLTAWIAGSSSAMTMEFIPPLSSSFRTEVGYSRLPISWNRSRENPGSAARPIRNLDGKEVPGLGFASPGTTES
jgi:hypothetical protein